uniref:RNA polymerase sigma factor n=1 Tax=uncultured Aminicenantes bacterium TaxID=174294 RepID=Q2YZY6_9BACT|nr:RNA polymerase sigma-E factor [uncultured Aminicenantes bacterium]
MDAAAERWCWLMPTSRRIPAVPDGNTESRSTMNDEQEASRELLTRIAAGDRNALPALYRIHGARLYAHALRVSGSREAAEDVVQESLLAVWKDAGRFRGEGRAIAWLLGIVHHKALDAIRGRSFAPREAEEGGLIADVPPPEEAALRREWKDRIKAGLERLSGKHRLALDLVFFQGLSLAEAADVCGCPVGTIKSRLNQAKAKLKAFLDEDGRREKVG